MLHRQLGSCAFNERNSLLVLETKLEGTWLLSLPPLPLQREKEKTEAEAPCSSYPKGLTKFGYEGLGGGKQVPSSVLTEDGGPPTF